MTNITSNGHVLFWIVDQVYQHIFQYNEHQDLKICVVTTQNNSTLHTTALCDHITYTYTITGVLPRAKAPITLQGCA